MKAQPQVTSSSDDIAILITGGACPYSRRSLFRQTGRTLWGASTDQHVAVLAAILFLTC